MTEYEVLYNSYFLSIEAVSFRRRFVLQQRTIVSPSPVHVDSVWWKK